MCCSEGGCESLGPVDVAASWQGGRALVLYLCFGAGCLAAVTVPMGFPGQ